MAPCSTLHRPIFEGKSGAGDVPLSSPSSTSSTPSPSLFPSASAANGGGAKFAPAVSSKEEEPMAHIEAKPPTSPVEEKNDDDTASASGLSSGGLGSPSSSPPGSASSSARSLSTSGRSLASCSVRNLSVGPIVDAAHVFGDEHGGYDDEGLGLGGGLVRAVSARDGLLCETDEHDRDELGSLCSDSPSLRFGGVGGRQTSFSLFCSAEEDEDGEDSFDDAPSPRRFGLAKEDSSLFCVSEVESLDDVPLRRFGSSSGLSSLDACGGGGLWSTSGGGYGMGVGGERIERSFREQLISLSPQERLCFDELKRRWQKEHGDSDGDSSERDLSDEMILRFARCSPGPTKFNADAAWGVMKSYDMRYSTLTAASVESALQMRTYLIPPGLKSKKGGHDVLYMRPSRFPAPSSGSCDGSACSENLRFSQEENEEAAIDALVYCTNVMLAKEKSCTEGIALLADMSDWTFSSHFSASYFRRIIQMLQGRIPVRVRLFLIVNPPPWFKRVWSFFRPVLIEDVRDKVHLISSSREELGEYLARGYEDYLPDDMEVGRARTFELVDTFISYRKHVEGNL